MKSTFNTQIPNTFSISVKAEEYVEYDSVADLQNLVPRLDGRRVLHIGGGSNLLFTRDFDGIVLHSRILGIEVMEADVRSVLVRVGAGMVWDDFVAEALRRGWYGAENLSLIPGEVGASAVQNIGAYGVEVKDLIERVECVDLQSGEVCVFDNATCRYAYRSSIFKQEWRGRYAVTHVQYRLSTTFVPHLDYGNIRAHLEGDTTAEAVREVIIRVRREKLPDPVVMGNAGSFFVNPVVPREQFEALRQTYPAMPFYEVDNGVKIPAGWLIEQSGWKGRALGPAAVHDRQALVLVNRGGATGEDVLRLSEAVCAAVQQKFGISIHPEVNVIG
ncbi:MAG: UDP-N-acetylmuramate dehydrogenase [Bacteroidaceae bacterium]|nr:UDP-N-acetylmuramate dehydrogenase [Bacteroidaceae bacterium]